MSDKRVQLRSLTQEGGILHIESSRGLDKKLKEFHKLKWVFDTSYYFNVEPGINKVQIIAKRDRINSKLISKCKKTTEVIIKQRLQHIFLIK